MLTVPLEMMNLAGIDGLQVNNKPEVQIRRALTTFDETPSPSDLGIGAFFNTSTGQIILLQTADRLVKQASEYMQSFGILEISEEDEKIVDTLVAARYENEKFEKLDRKI